MLKNPHRQCSIFFNEVELPDRRVFKLFDKVRLEDGNTWIIIGGLEKVNEPCGFVLWATHAESDYTEWKQYVPMDIYGESTCGPTDSQLKSNHTTWMTEYLNQRKNERTHKENKKHQDNKEYKEKENLEYEEKDNLSSQQTGQSKDNQEQNLGGIEIKEKEVHELSQQGDKVKTAKKIKVTKIWEG